MRLCKGLIRSFGSVVKTQQSLPRRWRSIRLNSQIAHGLSPLLVQEIFTIIRRLNKEQGVTLLLVEQNAQVALNTADHGYVLETGRIVMDGSAKDLLASDDIREFYLGQSAGDDRPEKRWKRKKTWR